MLIKHDRPSLVQRPESTVISSLGLGGWGIDTARMFSGGLAPNTPHVHAEIDLCPETGRNIEPVPHHLGPNYLRLLLPSTNCAAIVEKHGQNPAYPLWEMVDPVAIKPVTSTHQLGGYASPQVMRAALKLHEEIAEEFIRQFVARISHVGQEASVKSWSLFIFNGPCGSVGSAAWPVIDIIANYLSEPKPRVFLFTTLIADNGSVTGRPRARALQQGFLVETSLRAGGKL